MRYPLCRHVKTNGLRCQSPALADALYCYSTTASTIATQAFVTPPHSRLSGPRQHIQLSALEDRESVQVALSVVINALATGQLETKRATALPYGLQLPSTNGANLDFTPAVSKLAREVEATPDGLDLADPATDEEV